MRYALLAAVPLAALLTGAVVLTGNTYPVASTTREARATQAPLDDATIVAIFDAANTADMETGALAAKRGHSQEVKDFGAMLLRDHTQVRQLGRDLAKKLNITPTPPADDASGRAHRAAMKKLEVLSGREFDHAFLQHEAAYHKAVIDAVKTTLLPATKNAELKALEVKVAPAFEAHMMAAQQLDDKLQKSKRSPLG